jgi:hypothetical protein
MHLARVAKWQFAMNEYKEELHKWRDHKFACQALELPWTLAKNPPPDYPPVPKATPSDAELTEMLKRCTKDPADVSLVPTSKNLRSKKVDDQNKAADNDADKKPKNYYCTSARDYLRLPPAEVSEHMAGSTPLGPEDLFPVPE